MTDSNNAEDDERSRRGRIARSLALLGIERSEEERSWVTLTRRFPFIVLALFLVLLIGFGWFVHYSSSPEFCNTCHYMEPFYASWKESSHSDVGCLECHVEPGAFNYVRRKIAAVSEVVKTITATEAPKPHAEIGDAACLREGCHETRLEKPVVKFARKYHFNHAKHLEELRRGKKLRCTSCHSQMVQGEHITVTESVCFVCHFKGRKPAWESHLVGDCTSCHAAPSEPVETVWGDTFEHQQFLDRGVSCWRCHADSVQGAGDVPKQVCRDCHHVPEKLVRYDDSKFMHDWHVTKRKVECFQCHSEIRHGLQPEPESDGMTCARCHSGGHFPQQDLYRGRGGKDVEGEPGIHSRRQVDCIGCHQPPEGGGEALVASIYTHRAGKEACVACHGSAAAGMLAMWKRGLQQSLEETKSAIQLAEQKLKDSSDGEAGEAADVLEKARYNYEFVKRAHGVHNPGYALDLLDRAQSWAEQAAGAIKGQDGDERGEKSDETENS